MPSFTDDINALKLCFPVTKEQWDIGLSDSQVKKLMILALNALVCGGGMAGGGGGGCQPAQLTVTVIGGGGVAVSAGAFSQQSGTVVFSNANNVTFGMDSLGVVTASIAGGGGANSLTVSAGTTNNVVDALSFANANNAVFGINNSTLTVSAPVRISAGANSQNLTALTFGNANGVSFGLNAGTITGSHNGLTSQSNQAFSASGGSSTFQTLNFRNANGVTFSNNAGSIEASFSGGGGGSGITLISAGSTDATGPAIIFSNSNGITFGVDGNTVTASHNALTSQSNQAASAANGSFAFQTLSFSNLNGISFGTSAGSAITASHNGLTSQSNQAASASNGSFAFQTLGFSNANGITFGTSAGSIISASHNGLTSQSNQAASAANGSFTFQTIDFQDANNVSFITAGGSAIRASIQTSLTAINISAGSTSNNGSAFTFGDANGITFGLNGSLITASHNGITAQSNQTIGLFAVSNTTQGTSGTADARSLSFQGAGVASVGISNGSVVISVPAGGGGLTAINVSAGGASENLTNLVFSNSNNVSFGLNGSTLTAQALNTISWFENIPMRAGLGTNSNMTEVNNTPLFVPFLIPGNFTWSRMNIIASRTANDSNAFTIDAGLYTFVNSTLASLLGSVRNVYSNTDTGSVNNVRLFAITGFPTAAAELTQGQYVMALKFSAANTASMNYQIAGASRTPLIASINGEIHPGTNAVSTGNTSEAQLPIFGRMSVSSASLPDSVGQSDIRARYAAASCPLPFYFMMRQF